MDSKYKKRDDASARLGEKLLQGWTMLAAHCPSDECFTPLMRNKEGKMFCVGCDRFVITEEEAKKQEEEREAKEQEEREQLIKARFAQEQLEKQQAQRERDFQLQYERQQKQLAQQQQQQQQQQYQTPVQTTVAPAATVKRKSDDALLSTPADDDFLQACRRQTLASLYKKLEDLTNSLSSTDHSERILSTTKAINELAAAIQTLSRA